jgi:hypothetical protein
MENKMEQLVFIETNTDCATYTYEKCIVFIGDLSEERLKLVSIAEFNDSVSYGNTKQFCGEEVFPDSSFRWNTIVTLNEWIKTHSLTSVEGDTHDLVP